MYVQYVLMHIRVALNSDSWRTPPATLTTGSIRGKKQAV